MVENMMCPCVLRNTQYFLFMPITRKQKEEMLEHMKGELENAKGFVFVDYKGTAVNDINALRGEAFKNGVSYGVCKKTIAQRALDDMGIDLNIREMEGQVACAMSTEDEVTPAKIMADFAKDHENFNILAGILEQKALTAEEVTNLAKLPSKDELRGQLVATINAPVSGFVNVLAGTTRNLLNVLNAVKEQKEATA